MKQCSNCKIEKDESEFYKDNHAKDGLQSWCKDCRRDYQKTEFYKAYHKEREKTDRCKEYRRKYKKTDRYKEHQKEYRKKHRKTDEYKEWKNKYQKSEKYKQWKKKYRKKKRDTDVKYKLDDNMSGAIWKALKGKKAGRKWEELVGYTVEDLIKHLESKFESWMNWNNYGIYEEGKFKWHIDHIKPKSLFNYNGPEDEDFKECWALENLQPLEAIENIKKGNKIKLV